MKRSLIFAIKGYRQFISPLFPPSCRFEPTCSRYAIEAIERFGPIKGSALAAGRIVRCNPFLPGGYDPVPVAETTEKFPTQAQTDKTQTDKVSIEAIQTGEIQKESDETPA